MTTQPDRLYWDSSRYQPKFDRFWLPATSPPDLNAWWQSERTRVWVCNHAQYCGTGSEQVTYVHAEGQIPAELIWNARELYPEFQKQLLWALYEKAAENNLALLTKPRFWLYLHSRTTQIFECVAASLSVPMIDLERPL